MLDNRLKNTILRICQRNAPVDTRNLQQNAIKGSKWSDPNKFKVTYSVADAYYVIYLEESSFAGSSKTKPNKHKRFITYTYLELANLLENYFNKGAKKPRSRKFTEKQIQSTPRRDYVHNKSLDAYKARREVN